MKQTSIILNVIKNLIPIILIIFYISGFAQSNCLYSLNELKERVGNTEYVCGIVMGVKSPTLNIDNEETPYYINIGADYPNQLFTVVIWSSDLVNMKLELKYPVGKVTTEKSSSIEHLVDRAKSVKPNEWVGKEIEVFGKIESYSNYKKPQIRITKLDQIIKIGN